VPKDQAMIKLPINKKGLSLVELIVTVTVLSILASVILPSAQMTGKRMKDLELRRDLRIMRTAIDEFKKNADKMPIPPTKYGYPKTLEDLVEGVEFGDAAKAVKKKFLRRIPVDPLNSSLKDGKPQWGMRSYTDKPDSSIWGGDDVFDVYSLSEGIAIDGTKYKDW
jgi:general secretion pathway protein G